MSIEKTLVGEKAGKIAVLDDYQGVALQMADWSELEAKASITVFQDNIEDATALVSRLKPFNVICAMRERTPLPRTILEQLPNLKLIATTGMRNKSIDMEAARTLGITVCGTRSPSEGTSALAWALILAFVRNIPAESSSVRKGGWQVGVGGDLNGKTIGVVGLGRIGSSVAKIALAFGMEAIAWSQNLTSEMAQEHGAQLVSKEELFRQADIVTLHLMLSDRTQRIIGMPELKLMKPTALFVNTARSGLVDEDALLVALETGLIAGAALDVYEQEPLPKTHPLRSLGNVLATPHIGYVTRATYQTYYRETIENILAWMSGKSLRQINT